MTKRLDRDICFFHHGDDPVQGPGSYRGFGRYCQGCGEWVMEARVPCHGLPKSSKKQRLSLDEEEDVLKVAARQGVYIHASPLNPRSQVLDDLTNYYGSEKQVAAATTSPASRIRLAGDLYEMRLSGQINIRMSITREGDRFTRLLNSEIDRHIHSCFTLRPPAMANHNHIPNHRPLL